MFISVVDDRWRSEVKLAQAAMKTYTKSDVQTGTMIIDKQMEKLPDMTKNN